MSHRAPRRVRVGSIVPDRTVGFHCPIDHILLGQSIPNVSFNACEVEAASRHNRFKLSLNIGEGRIC